MQPGDDAGLPSDWARREAEPARKNVRRLSGHNDERMELDAEAGDAGERIPVACECGDQACYDALPLTRAELARAHAQPWRYVVLPRHVVPDYERVVEQAESYWIVEKRSPREGGLPGHAERRRGGVSPRLPHGHVSLMPTCRPAVQERLAVAPGSIREARTLVGGWSHDQGATEEQTLNIQLAVSELVANVVRHAHPAGGEHEFLIDARREDDDLIFCIRDFGVGPAGPSPTPGLGLGLNIAARLAVASSVTPADPGTLVEIRFPRTA